MEKIYCISGMGADGRIFGRLSVVDCAFIPVPWAAYDKDDDIRSYARKMSLLIPGDNPVILGLSYGGMLAVEISKIRPVKKLFLISSAKSTAELPQYGPIIQSIIRYGLIPAWFFSRPNRLKLWVTGARNADDRELLARMMKDAGGGFVKWALKSLLTWNSIVSPPHIIQVHGTKDLIIPPKNVHPNYWIKDGGHVMIYNRADEINKILEANV